MNETATNSPRNITELGVNIPPAVHDAEHRDGFYLVVRDVEHQVIVHRHDPEITAAPWLPVVDPEPLRHLVQLEDVLLQAIQLTVGVLLRLQVYCE